MLSNKWTFSLTSLIVILAFALAAPAMAQDDPEADRIAEKLEFHYIPKHGSWLNMAEIEFSVLRRKPCLYQLYQKPREAPFTKNV